MCRSFLFGENNMDLLDFYNGNSKLSFENEVQNLEFIQIIGDMDISVYTNPQIREKHLLDIGKKLLVNIILKDNRNIIDNEKSVLIKKNNIFRIRIIQEMKLLSQKEINDLLMTVDDYNKLSLINKIIHKIKPLFIYEWYLIILIKNKEYIYKIFGEKTDKNNLKNKLKYFQEIEDAEDISQEQIYEFINS
jgi:hypothetical protein